MDLRKQNLEFLQQPLRLRRGCLLVSRIDQETHFSKEFDWVIPETHQKKFTPKVFCHLHQPSPDWGEDEMTGRTLYIDKYAGLEIIGTDMVVIYEGAVLAVEETQ